MVIVSSRPSRLQATVRQLSLRSISSIGEDTVEEVADDEFTYSPSGYSTKDPSGSFGFNDSKSAKGSGFNYSASVETSFISPTQSVEHSPFSHYAGDSFGSSSNNSNNNIKNNTNNINTNNHNSSGRPPVPVSPSSMSAANERSRYATSHNHGSSSSCNAGSNMDDEGDFDSTDLLGRNDSRPVSLNSNDSASLAGIALLDTTSGSDGDSGKHRPSDARTHSAEEVAVLVVTGLPANAQKVVVAVVEDSSSKQKSRQLSLKQFFQPAAKVNVNTSAD
jgi:hypothetical protein